MKNIMVLMHSDDGQESRLQCALDVARAVEGHLNCLDVAATPIVYDDYVTNYTQAILLEDAVAAERENRLKLEPRLKVEGVPYTWLETSGPIADCIVDRAGLNDLVVVGTHAPKGEPKYGDVAANIVRRVRRPILAVPRTAERIDLFGTALIAWDGSNAADAALRAAMPLLRLAGKAVIVTVGQVERDPADAASYCSRHGVRAEVRSAPGGEPVSDVLLDQARKFGAGLIVMGAFGHSPLREAIFGGVTRRMLERSGVPLLIAS
ncbi:universal stress protein [Novosphingobium sp. Gsoil 351]|uniref:universal stress protein n=1 Tax=Novosphingobium sp. Gsoil 351 TaxID=2675225 RepID=UPI0012B4EB00|nr:universal stress protein [Novosphingobium sp. Gsoil 351]QGN55818.1 universal stress protein [Novosphingobium sp. Gsoil 351]